MLNNLVQSRVLVKVISPGDDIPVFVASDVLIWKIQQISTTDEYLTLCYLTVMAALVCVHDISPPCLFRKPP